MQTGAGILMPCSLSGDVLKVGVESSSSDG